MQSFSTWARWIGAIVAVVLFIVKDVVAPVVLDFIKKQPETDDAIHATLKFVLDLVQQPWLHVAAWILVAFLVGLWLDWLLRKLDGSRTKQRKALGFEMRSLGGHLRLSQLPIYEDRPQIMSYLATARKFGIWVPDERVFEISKRAENLIMEDPIRNLITEYLMNVGTLLEKGNFAEAKQHAENSKAAFAKAYAEHGFT